MYFIIYLVNHLNVNAFCILCMAEELKSIAKMCELSLTHLYNSEEL